MFVKQARMVIAGCAAMLMVTLASAPASAQEVADPNPGALTLAVVRLSEPVHVPRHPAELDRGGDVAVGRSRHRRVQRRRRAERRSTSTWVPGTACTRATRVSTALTGKLLVRIGLLRGPRLRVRRRYDLQHDLHRLYQPEQHVHDGQGGDVQARARRQRVSRCRRHQAVRCRGVRAGHRRGRRSGRWWPPGRQVSGTGDRTRLDRTESRPHVPDQGWS